MRPIAMAAADVVFDRSPDVVDVDGRPAPRAGRLGLRTIWTATEDERQAIAHGRDLALTFLGRFVPVALELADAGELGLGEEDPQVRRRLEQLRQVDP